MSRLNQKENNMSNRKTKMMAVKTGAVVITACAVCCAPLIAAPVVALFVAGGVTLALLGKIGLAALFILGGAVYFWHRNNSRKLQDTNKPCSCSSSLDHNTGDVCELPTKKK